MIGRILYHSAGLAFLGWVVLVPLKWTFLTGLAMFGLYAWDTRPGSEERAQRAEETRRAEPISPDEQARREVNRASVVMLRLIERRWLEGTVQALKPTGSAVDLEGVNCRLLFRPDVGPRHEVSNRAPWRIRVEPGATFRGEVSFNESDVSASGSPTALVEYRCRLAVQVVAAPSAPLGAPSNPMRMTPTGYRVGDVR